jgi:hypothetical protein
VIHDDAPPDFPAEAPDRLRARVAALMRAGGEESDGTPEAFLRVAERAIHGVLDAAPGDREAALDVLAADALVTRAIELLAGNAEHFEARCERIMQQLASIAPHRD